jgi:hypothetical protein
MKIFLTLILIICSNLANASNYSKPYIKMLLLENARNSLFVTPALAMAVAKVESDFRANAVSKKGAIGVMQIMPRTALLEFGVKRKDLFNPKINVNIGVKFLDKLIKTYKGDIGIALSHYNGGSAVGKWPNVKIIPATYPYVIKVLKNSNKFSEKTPSLTNIRKINFNKINNKILKLDKSSEIELLLNNIDKWLTIYNNHKYNLTYNNKNTLSNNKLVLKVVE